MKAAVLSKGKKDPKQAHGGAAIKLAGPSYFEVEYLKQLKEELEIFLRGKGFSTIQEFQIAFNGPGYTGQMSERA